MAKPQKIYVLTGPGGDVCGISPNLRELLDDSSAFIRNAETPFQVWAYKNPVLEKSIRARKKK